MPACAEITKRVPHVWPFNKGVHWNRSNTSASRKNLFDHIPSTAPVQRYMVCCSKTRQACQPDDWKVNVCIRPFLKIYDTYKISNIIVKGTSVDEQLYSM
jgi:hypothetical protein